MRTNWIPRRVHSRFAPRPALSTCRAGRRRRMPLSSSVALGLFSFVLVPFPVPRVVSCGYCLALSCLLRVSRAGVSVSPSCLLAIRSARSALSSYRSAPRSFDKWDGANTGCVSARVCLDHCCLLLAVAVPWMWRGGVFLSWVLLVAAVSMASAGCVISVVSVACCGSFYRAGVSRSCPAACFAHRCRRWPSWAGRHRVLSSWLRLVVVVVVVGERCRRVASSCLPSGVVVIRVRPVGASAVDISLIVSLIILLIVLPLVFSPCLACRAAGRRAVRVLSRPAV